MYYEYYAAQVMHNLGGDAWDYWNEGPGGKDSHTGIRDILIAKQCSLADKPGLPGATPPLAADLAPRTAAGTRTAPGAGTAAAASWIRPCRC